MRVGLTKLARELLRNTVRPMTTDYPVKTTPLIGYVITEENRGKHKFDDEKCVGCGGCSVICSSGAITESESQFERALKVELARCIFCGRCRDICPEKAIELTPEFELSQTGSKAENAVKVEHVVSLGRCEGCGRPIFPSKQIDAVKRRVDEKMDPSNKETASKDMEVYMRYCLDCRRTHSYVFRIHPRKSY